MFIYPDVMLLDFIRDFLDLKGFEVAVAQDCVEGFRIAINFLPELIVVNKEFPHLDAMGFLIKKRTSNLISQCPVFLVGDFSPKEIMEFKKEKVAAFLSVPINPVALTERINLFFNLPQEERSQKTPMLYDIHIRKNIIMVQIEGNLIADQLEILNYLIRSYCKKKKIKVPKVFYIIPSLYPENITLPNLERLLKLTTYPELTIQAPNIKFLTNCEKLQKLILSSDYRVYDLAKNFFDAVQTMQIDFKKEKVVPVDFLKTDNCYIFDLFDKQGHRLIPAMTRVTEEMLSKIRDKEIRSLTYYSDKEISAVGNESEVSVDEGRKRLLFDFITDEFEPIERSSASLDMIDAKQSLFLRSLKGQNALVVSKRKEIQTLLDESLNNYFKMELLSTGNNIDSLLKVKRYSIIFLDAANGDEQILVLQRIRTQATRRKTSVLVLFDKIDKATVIRYRNSGTDNIVLSPFSSSTILKKIFHSVNQDRGL
ncbi:MAG: hypothetical protein JXR70_06565 [Spirochaetales bacterium]|nr:hypothetical protein [Spirochaetales bacterium]